MSRMKLFNVTDIEGFFKIIDSCKGSVRLVGEGLDLDLKSRLAQYFSLARCFGGDHLEELELVLENDADAKKFFQFAMDGRKAS